MQHLETTRLAAFDHDPFTVDELAHLAACASCRRERDAIAQLVAVASAEAAVVNDADAPRLVSWDALAAGLRREGLLSGEAAEASPVEATVVPISQPSRVVASAPARRSFAPLLRRAAAAMVLVAGGAIYGRLSVGASALTNVSSASFDTARNTLRPAAYGGVGEFASIDQATDVLNRAQRDYERASLWLAANDSTVRDSEVYRARLAALDQMMAASRVALRDAPQDPVLNHYYLAAYTAREATLQQLGGALPVDKVIERY
jgi:hypothetical protein